MVGIESTLTGPVERQANARDIVYTGHKIIITLVLDNGPVDR